MEVAHVTWTVYMMKPPIHSGIFTAMWLITRGFFYHHCLYRIFPFSCSTKFPFWIMICPWYNVGIAIINHPPVITIFMGAINHQKWVVDYCYTNINPPNSRYAQEDTLQVSLIIMILLINHRLPHYQFWGFKLPCRTNTPEGPSTSVPNTSPQQNTAKGHGFWGRLSGDHRCLSGLKQQKW